MKEIAFTKVKLPFGWLGNMARFPIVFNEKEWPTSEALFQALRFKDGDEIQEQIRLAKSPMTAKFLAKAKETQKRMVIEPQSEEDVDNMRWVLLKKVSQHPSLKEKLLATGDAVIIEDCTKRQRGSGLFWGAAKTEEGWKGENVLGKLWMELRASLPHQKALF